MNGLKLLKNGIWDENPTLRLFLGMCPSLALSATVQNSLRMGLATTAVLIVSNALISLLRNIITREIRLPAYIVLISGLVSVLAMLTEAFLPPLHSALGIYLPLIAVNCIIFARAEIFASKNGVWASMLDGAGAGLGFTAALTLIGSVREIAGAGSWMGLRIFSGSGMLFFSMPAGGFFVLGLLTALFNAVADRKRPAKSPVCGPGCPAAAVCGGCAPGEEDRDGD